MEWIKASERLPEIKDKKSTPVFVTAEFKKYNSDVTYRSKRVCYYFPEHFKSIEFEDWDDYEEEDYPYTENDKDKGIIWLKPGWYELVNCDKCDGYWSAPLNVIEWLDESHPSAVQAEALRELEVTEKLLEERQRVLDAIPECPVHGKCVPHALEWIEKALASLSAPQDEGWVSVEDRLPEENEEYLVRFYSGEQRQCFHEVGYWDGTWHFAYNKMDESLNINDATHWRKLPSPPNT